jgi:hypothetical protein
MTTPLDGKLVEKSGWPVDEFRFVKVPRGVKPIPDLVPVLILVAPDTGGVDGLVQVTPACKPNKTSWPPLTAPSAFVSMPYCPLVAINTKELMELFRKAL